MMQTKNYYPETHILYESDGYFIVLHTKGGLFRDVFPGT